MGVNKAEMKLVGTQSLPLDASIDTTKYNLGEINPFGSFTATAPAQFPVDSNGKFVFWPKIVSNEENGLAKQLPFTLPTESLRDLFYKHFAGYLSQVQKWDKSVDASAAATIRNNWPKLGDIDMALASNPRLQHLALRANHDYV